MIEIKDLGTQAGLVGFGRSFYVLSIFILNIGLARSMGTVAFGSFQQVFMFSALFIILTMGIPETMYFFLPRLTSEKRARFLGQTLLVLAVTGVCIIVLFWFGAPFFAHIQKNSSIVPQIRVFGIYGGFLVASSFSDPIFITFKRIRYLFILSILHAFFFIALTIWYSIMESSPYILFAAMAGFGLFKYLLAISLLISLRTNIGEIHFFRGTSMLLLQLSFSLPIALSSAIDIISRWLDKFVVSIFLGPESLGIFYVGAIEIPFIGVIVSSVYSVVSPVLNTLHHKNDIEGFVNLTSKTLKFIAKFVWPVFIYLFVFADRIIPLVFKSEFQGAVTPFRIYLLIMPLRIALYGAIIIALGRPHVVLWSACVALIINFVLNILLVLSIGFIGPAIATVISTYIHIFLLLYIILKELNIRAEDLIPFNFFFALGITCGLSVMFAYAVTNAFDNDLKSVVYSLIIFSGSYLFLGSKAGFIHITDFVEFVKSGFSGKKFDS